jgi:GSH-dependent disulfide-bond oxidoreductase
MYNLYTAPTPNGWKVSIYLEELKIPYTVNRVDLASGEQFTEAFRAINPNCKIPVLVDLAPADTELKAIFESGSILIYLAEKHASFLTNPNRSKIISWLMFQMSAVGPMLGQLYHFKIASTISIPYAIERYEAECHRLFGVMDSVLKEHSFIAGDDYSIADISIFPWVHITKKLSFDISNYKNLIDWYDRINSRESTAKGMAVPE